MIFLGIVFVPFVTFVLALGVSSVFFFNSLGASAHETLRAVAIGHARDIEAFIEERQHDLGFVFAAFPAEKLSQSETMDSVLALLRRRSPAFVGLELVDARGGRFLSVPSRNLVAGVCEKLPWGNATAARRVLVSELSSDDGGPARFVIAKRDPSGSSAVICATMDAGAIFDILAANPGKGADDVFLLDGEGRIQARSGSGGLFERVPGLADGAAQDGRIVSFVHEGESGARYLTAVTPLCEGRWMLAVRQRFGDAFNDLVQAGWYILAISLLGGMLTVFLASTVSRRIGKALQEADEARDVLRERLSRSVRLAELGEMAAGFAHEINNPLQVMESEIMMMDLVLDDFRASGGEDAGSLGSDLRNSLDELQRQIQRCSKVTRSILSFGRQESLGDGKINLGLVMRDLAEMIRKKAEIKSIDIHVGIESEALAVLGDVGKIRQVFLNLLNNAVYALVEKFAGGSGGRLEFTARPGGQGWVLIEIRDNGPGLPKEVLSNMYTPFFTTKPPQKGTGLGLSVCYGLIESMGGSIDVETRQGEGTVFRITLPAA